MDKFLTKKNSLPRLKSSAPQILKAPLFFRNGMSLMMRDHYNHLQKGHLLSG